MSYAFVEDVPATWTAYLGIAEMLEATCPEGMVIHAAGPTDEGFRMIGIWESLEACARFREERLSTILATLAVGSRLGPTYRELSVAHLLSVPAPTRAHGHPGHGDMQPSSRKPHKQEES